MKSSQGFWQVPPDHQVQERNSVKVRTVLRQFVRDWADEGAKEREVQYGCLLDALERHVPKTGGRPKIGVAMGDLKLPTTNLQPLQFLMILPPM